MKNWKKKQTKKKQTKKSNRAKAGKQAAELRQAALPLLRAMRSAPALGQTAKNPKLPLVLFLAIWYTDMVYLDFVPVCRHLQGELDLEKLTYTHKDRKSVV